MRAPRLKKQSGLVVMDFVFSLVLASGMAIILFSLSYTLTVVEITQYISYSTARAHMAGNASPEKQEERAREKYAQLINGNGAVASLYKNDWFEIATAEKVDIRGGDSGDGQTFGRDLAGGGDRRNWFMGVSVPLHAPLMKLKLPFIGDTSGGEDEGFKTRLNTMLIRDVSTSECQRFIRSRGQAIGRFPSSQPAGGLSKPDPNAYVPMEDNGC